MEHLIAHLDMNSYFASVEQQANPFLRGKAVGVCAYLHARGCVIAASVEAKQLGMKVGMNVEQAKTIVPSAVFVENDPAKYRAVSSRVFRLLREYTDQVEIYSIDEAFMNMTGWCRDPAEAAFLFSRIKLRLRTEIGEWLRCSVGIAPTRFLAKFASDFRKPDGLTVITPETIDEHLAVKDLEDAWGIGPRLRRRLEGLGIKTLLDLKHYPVQNLMSVLGKMGYVLWAHVNGIEVNAASKEGVLPKTIGHSYCVPRRVNREGTVEAVLTRLVERAGRRLRGYGLRAGRIEVMIGFSNPPPFEGGVRGGWRQGIPPPLTPPPRGGGLSVRLSDPTDDPATLIRAAATLLHELWRGEYVSFLAVTLGELQEKTGQMEFHGRAGRPSSLTRSLDLIRDKHGEEAIVYGRMSKMIGKNDAPDRIGFRKTEGRGWEGSTLF